MMTGSLDVIFLKVDLKSFRIVLVGPSHGVFFFLVPNARHFALHR
jgi:hypothetical protein